MRFCYKWNLTVWQETNSKWQEWAGEEYRSYFYDLRSIIKTNVKFHVLNLQFNSLNVRPISECEYQVHRSMLNYYIVTAVRCNFQGGTNRASSVTKFDIWLWTFITTVKKQLFCGFCTQKPVVTSQKYSAIFVCSLQRYLNIFVFESFSLQHLEIRIFLEKFFETRESKFESLNLVLNAKLDRRAICFCMLRRTFQIRTF